VKKTNYISTESCYQLLMRCVFSGDVYRQWKWQSTQE